MYSTTISQIKKAIEGKKIIRFSYKGKPRIAEPHILGICNDKEQLQAYQIGGSSSSGGLPEWRRFDVSSIKYVSITEKTFAGKRETESGEYTNWDEIIAVVD